MIKRIFILGYAIFLQANDSLGVTYEFSGGRFGDNLLTYFHAKWISYQSGAVLLYKPFPYSDKLMLSEIESAYNLNYKNNVWLSKENDPSLFYNYSNTLLHVKYFPELSWGGDCRKKIPKFHPDWDDAGFRGELKKCLTPKFDISPTAIAFSEGRISVAVHYRTGGKFEPDLHDVWALKAPRDTFFIKYIKYLYKFFEEKPLFVYIFTDHSDPKSVRKLFEKNLEDQDIVVATRDQPVGWTSDVLEDFFSMTQFNCSIHGDSNFSICAGILADHDIEIRPLTTKTINNKEVIDDVVMRIHFKKDKRPEYRVISH